MDFHRTGRATHSTRLARMVACLGLFALTPVSSVSIRTASEVRYRLVVISLKSPDSFPTAINSSGEVIGQMGGANTVPFVYRSGGEVSLIPPAGLSDVQVEALNDAGTIAVQAEDADGTPIAFAARPQGHGFKWIKLALGQFDGANVSVSAVAKNGDIDGTISSVSSTSTSQLRSVLWRVTSAGGYRTARALPISKGFTSTISGGIWRRKGETYVAGAQSTPADAQYASIWSPHPNLKRVPGENLFAGAVGGKGGKVFTVGTMEGSGLQGWLAPLAFGPKGRAQVGRVSALPTPPGYNQCLALGVAVNAAGIPVTVGDALSSSSSKTTAVVWKGEGPASLLQTEVATPWTITEAAGISSTGEIAAAGTYRGRLGALLLVPKG